MKKLLLFLACAGLLSINVVAQPHCFTTEYYLQDLQNPEFVRNQKILEDFTKDFVKNQSQQRTASTPPYIIPIVFHILHDYGQENVPDSMVIGMMNSLNEDYRKRNADTNVIVPAFTALAADCEIEFRLATIDPNGDCTTGIEHIPTLKTYLADDNSKTDPSWLVWPNNKYLNIWVAQSLANSSAAAYAHYPGGPDAVDGIMCWYTYVDNTTNTITHEAGHFFNLAHPWGNTNDAGITCGDDGVSDTPITKGFPPSANCPLNHTAICNPPIEENIQNYMDYSYCDHMFTYGQKTRMQASLNSAISHRNNLWSPANLIATGTDGTAPSLCPPVADFKIDYDNACTTDSVRFTDQSWKGAATTYNWSFPGGSPATSNLRNPTTLYAVAGQYSATLMVSNSAGSDTITKTSIIRVSGSPLNTVPFVEGFEDSTSFPGNDGWIESISGGPTWQRITTSAATGAASIRMNNFTNAAGEVDDWITPSMDFSSVNFPIILSFKVANAQRNSSTSDQLKIYYTLNCGKTWGTTSYSKQGATLATAGIVTANFIPNNSSHWRQENVTVNQVKLKPNVRFKFSNISGHGNNTYIDDINITGNYVGVEETEELQNAFSLYPNPTSGSTYIDFSLSKSAQVKIEVKNIIGQSVHVISEVVVEAGYHQRMLPSLSPGIYLVDLQVNNKHHVRKLVVSE